MSIDTDTNVYFMRQFQCLPTTYVIENKETYFEIYTYQESCPLARLFKTSQSAYQD